MEKLDPNLEAQVWRRIGGTPQPDRGDLRPLLGMAWEQASVLRHAAGMLTGSRRTKLKGVIDAAVRAVEAQKGIMSMAGCPFGQLRPQPVPRESARRLLEKAYHRSCRLMTEYTARSLDPEFGVVWKMLADREQENAATLAEVLGNLDG